MLSGDLQSVSHITLKLGHIYLVTHVVYPVSPGLCLPSAVPLPAIEITTIDSKGSLPTIPVCEPIFKRFSDKPLGRTDGFVHATTVLSPPSLYPLSCQVARNFKACSSSCIGAEPPQETKISWHRHREEWKAQFASSSPSLALSQLLLRCDNAVTKTYTRHSAPSA